MDALKIKPAHECKYDFVALGEVMLRLDPGEGRISTAGSFDVWEGGGEYNVAKGLSYCFKMRTSIVTSLVDNDIGQLIKGRILQGGVDFSLIKWEPFDGIGGISRNGLYFMERGFGIRGAKGVSDRGLTAVSQLKPGDIDWEDLFGNQGVRWFHTGGIFAGLSDSTPDVIEEAMSIAKKYGTIISYDLNYRPSLWEKRGGKEASAIQNNQFKRYLDMQIGIDADTDFFLNPDRSDLKKAINNSVKDFPNIKVVASTIRNYKTASINDWGAICRVNGEFFEAKEYKNLEILDRVGGGDAFGAGLIYGFLTNRDPQKAINYGLAHGAICMTTPGDTTMSTLEEVENAMSNHSGKVFR
jgi:2-dehydro-3-deoxygluconokinase